jgi:hypothetical protein
MSTNLEGVARWFEGFEAWPKAIPDASATPKTSPRIDMHCTTGGIVTVGSGKRKLAGWSRRWLRQPLLYSTELAAAKLKAKTLLVNECKGDFATELTSVRGIYAAWSG